MTAINQGTHQISTPVGEFVAVIGGTEAAIRYCDQIVELDDRDSLDPAIRDEYLRTVEPPPFRQVFLDRWSVLPGFTVITLWHNDELAGYVCGSTASDEWWLGLSDPIEPFPQELTDAPNTVNLIKILVRREFRSQKLGTSLHKLFLQTRSEKQVILISQPQLQPAYSIWHHWGYQKVGTFDADHNGKRISDVLARIREV